MQEPAEKIDGVAETVVDAALEVHRTLGPGFLENIYENALGAELDHRGVSTEFQKPIEVEYRGEDVGRGRLDLLVEGLLVVELKAVDELAPIHRAQVLSYLKATDLPLGLLLNFNTKLMKDGIRRVVLSDDSRN